MVEDYAHIRDIANKDVDTLIDKGKSYGSSWRNRGGVGAFMMLARKWDRIENQCKAEGYNIFDVVKKDLSSIEDGLLDDIRDLRAYLLLVESHMTAAGRAPTTTKLEQCKCLEVSCTNLVAKVGARYCPYHEALRIGQGQMVDLTSFPSKEEQNNR